MLPQRGSQSMGTKQTPASIAEFISILLGHIQPVAEVEVLEADEAVGRVSADQVVSRIPLPPFDQSAMDGFGLTQSDLDGSSGPLRVAGLLAAGTAPGRSPEPGTAVRLFTGSVVPQGIAAVARRERCIETSGFIQVSVPVAPGEDIRKRGEDLSVGEEIVPPETVLDARHVAILHATGNRRITVRRRIRVVVLSIGQELGSFERPLAPGMIYDSNGPMIRALLQAPHMKVDDGGRNGDDPVRLARYLRDVASHSDLIVCSGGAGGSQTDPVVAAARLAGGEASNFSLALAPGKPVVYGSLGQAILLGLPGNPFAAFISCQLFARSAGMALAGVRPHKRRGVEATLAAFASHKTGRTEFLPASIVGEGNDGRLIVLPGRPGAGRLGQLAHSDGIIELAADQASTVSPGTTVAFFREGNLGT